jgi:hypothetical protein
MKKKIIFFRLMQKFPSFFVDQKFDLVEKCLKSYNSAAFDKVFKMTCSKNLNAIIVSSAMVIPFDFLLLSNK